MSAYRRLAGSGRDGDERLREATRRRNEALAKCESGVCPVSPVPVSAQADVPVSYPRLVAWL